MTDTLALRCQGMLTSEWANSLPDGTVEFLSNFYSVAAKNEYHSTGHLEQFLILETAFERAKDAPAAPQTVSRWMAATFGLVGFVAERKADGTLDIWVGLGHGIDKAQDEVNVQKWGQQVDLVNLHNALWVDLNGGVK